MNPQSSMKKKKIEVHWFDILPGIPSTVFNIAASLCSSISRRIPIPTHQAIYILTTLSTFPLTLYDHVIYICIF